MLPCAARASSRMARTLTSANSAATKNALAASSRTTSRRQEHRDPAPTRRAASRAGRPAGRAIGADQVRRAAVIRRQQRRVGRDVGAGERLADAAQEHEPRPAASAFLSRPMAASSASADSPVAVTPRSVVGRPDRARWPRMPVGVARRAEPEPDRQGARQHHADGHRLAVQQRLAVARERLERVARRCGRN